MTVKKFTSEERLLNHLVLHANDTPTAIGLLNGQMGIALVLAHYARMRQCKQIEKISDFLLEHIITMMAKTSPVNFANGLCGIGWGIEYLIQNGYMKGCGADILQDVDAKIMELDVRRLQDLSIDTGLEGMLHYVLAHLQGANKAGCSVFDKEYLETWKVRMQLLSKDEVTGHRFEKMFKMLVEGIHGNRNFYPFQLARFIRLCKDPKRLSLKEGAAGRLELLLNQSLEQAV